MADSDTTQQVVAITANNQRSAALQAEIRAIFENNQRGAAIEAEIEAILRAREPLKKALAEFKALCENNQRTLANNQRAHEALKKAMAEIKALRENNQRARAIFKNNQRGAAIEAEIEAILRAREALEKVIAEFKAPWPTKKIGELKLKSIEITLPLWQQHSLSSVLLQAFF